MFPSLLLLTAALLGGEEVLETWPDGKVRARYTIDERGDKHGSYEEYYRSGALAVEATYKAGQLSGAYLEFHANGEKALDCRYRDGALHGKYVEWDENGDELWVCRYDKGLLDGKCEAFEGRTRLVTQLWKDGALVELDGIDPYPRSLAEVRGTVRALTDDETPLPGSPPEPGVWGTPDEAEAADEGLRRAREQALRTLVAYRYLCGVNHEGLTLTEEFNHLSTMGARLCDAIGRLDHTPDNPGWPSAEYQEGYAGTSGSNLASAGDLRRSVHMYMDDSDPTNIDHVGHRRHCLSTGLGRLGFGRHGGYSAMYVAGGGGKGGRAKRVCYPPPGYVPTEYFGSRHAWSIDLGGARPKLDGLTIVVRALDDLYVPEETLEIDHLSRSGSTLIFRPKGVVVTHGKAYVLEITGLDGKRPVSYMVEFFDLESDD